MSNEQMQQAIRDLQDAMIVTSEIEKRQSEILRIHTEKLAEVETFQRRTEQNLAEITDKLNGLIGYVAGQRPGESPRL
ncbi:MAG TPA: hypothetical protein VMB25_14760 [Bryobacteraceae bacterium]|nr:hypothetical protein [Bryobacteraceae bacterium]